MRTAGAMPTPKTMTPDDALGKLQAREVAGTEELLRLLGQARVNVQAEIRKAAARARLVTDAGERERLYGRIQAHYDALAAGIDRWSWEAMGQTAADWHGVAAADLAAAGREAPVFDRNRVRRYFEEAHPANGEALAAVFTNQMADAEVRNLRSALVDTMRQGSIEGWSANETHKALHDRWDALACDTAERRFVDKAGRAWTNADYLNMLTRTTQERVTRDSFVDTLAAAGFSLARIAGGASEVCDVCRAWQDLIVQIAGPPDRRNKYPTYAEAKAAGVFHPNCTHYLEYVDATVDAADASRQAGVTNPDDWADAEAVDRYNDTIRMKEYTDGGMTIEQAYRARARDKIETSIRVGTLSDELATAARSIPPEALAKIDLQRIPRFRLAVGDEKPGSRNTAGGGVVVVDRDGSAADARAALDGLLEKQGIIGDAPAAPPPPPKEDRRGISTDAEDWMRSILTASHGGSAKPPADPATSTVAQLAGFTGSRTDRDLYTVTVRGEKPPPFRAWTANYATAKERMQAARDAGLVANIRIERVRWKDVLVDTATLPEKMRARLGDKGDVIATTVAKGRSIIDAARPEIAAARAKDAAAKAAAKAAKLAALRKAKEDTAKAAALRSPSARRIR